LTTARDVHAKILDPGWYSRYCLRHGPDAGPFYHRVHLAQHIHLYAITADPVFAWIADLFYQEFPPYDGGGTVWLAAGSHTGVRVDRRGRPAGQTRVSLPRAGTAQVGDVVKVRGQRGLWYAITTGRLAGLYVQGTARSYHIGAHAIVEYSPARTGRVRTTPLPASAVDAAGHTTTTATAHQAGDRVAVAARAVLNGVPHLRLASGSHAGRWVAATTIDLEPVPARPITPV